MGMLSLPMPGDQSTTWHLSPHSQVLKKRMKGDIAPREARSPALKTHLSKGTRQAWEAGKEDSVHQSVGQENKSCLPLTLKG